MFSFPWHFFMVNDNNKVIPIVTQNMFNEIFHSIFQTYNYGNITKKRKDVIKYNHQHETSMKRHILANHSNA